VKQRIRRPDGTNRDIDHGPVDLSQRRTRVHAIPIAQAEPPPKVEGASAHAIATSPRLNK